MKRLWLKIPRKIRVFINIIAIILLITAAYILLGCPALTPTQAFRRVEKSNLTGPAEIIEIIDLPNGLDDHVLVADDGDGAVLFMYSDFEFRWQSYFLYREKSEGITVLPVPNHTHFGADLYELDMPILVFHDHPGAVRAELALVIDEGMGIRETQWEEGGEVHVEYFEKTYRMEAASDIDGYFRFNLHAESEDWYVDEYGQNRGTHLGNEGWALQTLCRMITEVRAYLQEYATATVRLYDAENHLITEETVIIRSVNGQRYADDQS